MNSIHTQGVVLRYTNTNESDRMLTVFSPELGKLSILAKGCRKQKSRFLSAVQLFCYSEFVLLKVRDLYILSQADVQNTFFDLRCDLERLAYGTYILNLAEEAVNAGEGSYRLFALLLETLSYLSYGDIKASDVTSVFELKFVEIVGFKPELDHCALCDCAPTHEVSFSINHGGIVCSACMNNAHAYPIHADTLQIMRHVLAMKMEGIQTLKFYPEARTQMQQILPNFISEKLDKRFKSREYLDELLSKSPDEENSGQ